MPPDRRDFLKSCALASFALSVKGKDDVAVSPPDTRSLSLGAGRLDVINIGDITAPMSASMRTPAGATEAEKQAMRATLADHRLMPMQDVLVRLPGLTVMVDAGAYDIQPAESYVVPGYTPPPTLGERLAALGVAPDSVEHVVFTHRHFDHINGAVVKSPDGALRPLFPKARHYIQKPDWDYALTKINDLNTRLGRTFSVLRPAGLVEVVNGDIDLGRGVKILAAPGETPGHQAVRVESRGQVAYLVGDMIHHASEVAHPGFMVDWADQATNEASRRRIYEAAADEGALMVASHIPQAGRFSRIAGQPAWTDC
jgi:glyoxylase-like metal-dependent hydrolase (beta-lactamase superfamily II)